ncbi:hypothetical protein [Streptomyces canus]|uniref:hypothetical protein n=1 Tax=Streptomyces canus TaxID=58343 RepID=UPI003CF51DBB
MAMPAGLARTLPVTVCWQTSVHTAVATGSMVTLLRCYDRRLLPALALILAAAWSRTALKAIPWCRQCAAPHWAV